MAEVIKNNRGQQRQNRVSKDNLAHLNGKLFLVDNDDDDAEDYDMRSQDVDEAHTGHDVEADKDEDIEDMMFENIQNEMEDDESSKDVNELGLDEDGLQRTGDVEMEDFEQLMFENNQLEIEGNEDEDDLQSEDNDRVSQLTKRAGISTMKKRGPTMMHGVQLRKLHEREVIICNEFGQPIGPVTEEKDIVGGFSRFLGTIARNNNYAPLTYDSWHKVPHKDKIWEYVLQKYIVPENAKTWVLMSIGADWRGYKCRLKKKHFYKYKNNRTRWNNRPECIPEKDFSKLLQLWNNKKVMMRSAHAKKIRMSQKNMHTAGPKSFAIIREEMEQMENYKPEDGNDKINPFLYGRGVTSKLLKKVNGGDKADVEAEKSELMVMRRELEEDHERKKAELAEDHERKKAELAKDHEKKKAELEAIQKDINNNRDKFVEEAVQKLLEKLPPGLAQQF